MDFVFGRQVRKLFHPAHPLHPVEKKTGFDVMMRV
jgi:hypothetical protein